MDPGGLCWAPRHQLHKWLAQNGHSNLGSAKTKQQQKQEAGTEADQEGAPPKEDQEAFMPLT